MSEAGGAEVPGGSGDQPPCSPLRRTVDLCVFAPVGVAISVVEDLPGFITKGRKRVELHLGNARVVGRYVVDRGQRTLSGHLETLMGDRADAGTKAPPEEPAPRPEAPAVRPAPDPDAGAVVGQALADYDTLSASQVVRRLESLGPDELRAVQRYEASTRNRRTILNRAGQLLAGHPSAPARGNGSAPAGSTGQEADGTGSPGADG